MSGDDTVIGMLLEFLLEDPDERKAAQQEEAIRQFRAEHDRGGVNFEHDPDLLVAAFALDARLA